jgi:hypothetical protein
VRCTQRWRLIIRYVKVEKSATVGAAFIKNLAWMM